MADAQANQEQIRYWNEQGGPRWVQRQQQLDAQINPLGLAAMQHAGVTLGERVLDVGCGCGQTSLELAQRVGASGSVVGIDISQPMLTRACERQQELGLKNLEFLHADAQTYVFARERFDLIFSRFGVMFFADPAAAFANLRTALRSDGRLCFLCWQTLEKNEWARVPFLAATRHVQPPAPPAPDAPGPFAFANPDRVRRLLEAGGFKDVSCESYAAELSMGGARTIEEAVEFSLEIGPIARLLGDADTDVRTRVAQAVREAFVPYVSQHGVSLRGAAWIVLAQPNPK
ncbi:MAG TPA: class I SAM-dependent methyltransferase [Candidatus Binatia bacterium]|jgi:SAM-dependent methyltransferase|nr:class I SAM-dependent methyltransferase [Candidatus Binatia bacterium]